MAVPFAGVLPFGAVLVELVFVMTAMWEQQLYYIFGFLMSVMLILTVTCAEISIVMCYFQLCSEDYRWCVAEQLQQALVYANACVKEQDRNGIREQVTFNGDFFFSLLLNLLLCS